MEANVAVATLPNLLFPAQPVRSTNGQVIEEFIAYLRTEKGLAQNTIEAYRSDLVQLSEFLGGRQFVKAETGDLRNHVGQLLIQVSARSAARKVVTMRQFFKFLAMDGRSVLDH